MKLASQYHFKLFSDLFSDKLSKIFLYDIKLVIDKKTIDYLDISKIVVTNNWEDVYKNSDVFITCTVAKDRYIDKKPKNGSLQLNISLRDYKIDTFDYFKNAIRGIF